MVVSCSIHSAVLLSLYISKLCMPTYGEELSEHPRINDQRVQQQTASQHSSFRIQNLQVEDILQRTVLSKHNYEKL